MREALAAGALDGRAVQLLARQPERTPPGPLTGLDPRLDGLERAAPNLSDYDRLIGGAR
jgi:hypothetical protein